MKNCTETKLKHFQIPSGNLLIGDHRLLGYSQNTINSIINIHPKDVNEIVILKYGFIFYNKSKDGIGYPSSYIVSRKKESILLEEEIQDMDEERKILTTIENKLFTANIENGCRLIIGDQEKYGEEKIIREENLINIWKNFYKNDNLTVKEDIVSEIKKTVRYFLDYSDKEYSQVLKVSPGNYIASFNPHKRLLKISPLIQ